MQIAMPPMRRIASIEMGQNVLDGDLCTAGVLLKVCSINPEYEAEINSRSSQ
jgi:hypothetical protein